jgi:hypothetical protein
MMGIHYRNVRCLTLTPTVATRTPVFVMSGLASARDVQPNSASGSSHRPTHIIDSMLAVAGSSTSLRSMGRRRLEVRQLLPSIRT